MNNKRLMLGLDVLVLVLFSYLVYSAIQTASTTGKLSVDSTDKKAVLTISQEGHAAKIIGTGNARIRLKPGTYQVAAVDKASQAFSVVKISKSKVVSVSLTPSTQGRLPSLESINFQGLSALSDKGLSAEQLTDLKQAFFKLKPSAQVVSIDDNSVYPAAHDPDKDIGFSINFDVSVDSTKYKAVISYVELNELRLVLYDPTSGTQIYDSGVLTTP